MGKRLTIGLAIVVAVIVPFLAYGMAYVLLTVRSHHTLSGPPCFIRHFRTDWEAQFFVPAAMIEKNLSADYDYVVNEGPTQYFESDGTAGVLPPGRW